MEKCFWSFDGTEGVSSKVVEPARYRQLYDALTTHPHVIARGAGLSYCNASAGDRSASISSRYFNRVREFDRALGIIDVETGISIGQLTRIVLDEGWIPPVLPGHPAITVGGCIGFNVHGKSQHDCGHFVSCIESLELYHPDHGRLMCSPHENREIFEVTVGGFGLTGYVTSVRLRLKKLAGRSLVRESIPVANLTHAVEVMETADASASIFSWHDLSRSGVKFGAGVVYVDWFDETDKPWTGSFHKLTAEARRRFRVRLFNRATTPLVNLGYRCTNKLARRTVRLPLESGIFPINGKELYYSMFGRTGLREYQALVPRSVWDDVASTIRDLLQTHRVAPTLASLKLFKGDSSHLDFCGSGVCIAIDVPATHHALDLFEEIDRVVIEASGIANLSKDSRISTGTIREMFPAYESFTETVRSLDPKNRFRSSLGERIFG
jgi:decaprenylphospho-beta-D-ribofuranose 2-oxidase